MSTETRMDKLNAKNYSSWSILMSSLLKSRGLFDWCREQKAITEADITRVEEAKHLIYSSMDAAQISATGSCVTAYDLWMKVKENNEGAEVDMRNNALNDFLGIRYTKGESIIQYCGRFESLLARLVETGYAVDDKLKLYAFRNSLPEKYKDQIFIWTTANREGKFNQMLTYLKVKHHQDKSEKSEDSVAFYGNDRGRPGDKRQSSTNSNPTSNSNDSDKFCTYCKMNNHFWRECRKLKSDNERKRQYASNRGDRNAANNNNNRDSNNRNGSNRNNHNRDNNRYNNRDNNNRGNERNNDGNSNNKATAYVARTPRKDPISDHDVWIIDSGASRHMTSHKGLMHDYSKFNTPRKIFLGDGKPTAAYGEGKISFDSDGHNGILLNVLWVPALTENLFSVTQAMNKDCEITFADSEVHFIKDGQINLRGFKRGHGLFVLHLNSKFPEEEKALIGATENEWHKRFGHASLDTIRELSRKNAVEGLDFSHKRQETCLDCIMGKMCRASHPSRSTHTATETSAVLHIDTCGPMSIPSLGGSKYFVLAVDELSDYKIIGFVSTKRQVASEVKAIIVQAELESKRTVKAILTDGGSEYCNGDLDTWLYARGTQHLLSSSYTPQQNGKVERANRTIIEGTRTLLHHSKLPYELWAEAARTVVYTSNRLLSKFNPNKTRYEIFHNQKPNVSNLRVFGQQVIARIPDVHRSTKWSAKGEVCKFIGYTDRVNTYRLYDQKMQQIFISSDVIFSNVQSIDTNEIEPHHDGAIFTLRDNTHLPRDTDSDNNDAETLIDLSLEDNNSRVSQSISSNNDNPRESTDSDATEIIDLDQDDDPRCEKLFDNLDKILADEDDNSDTGNNSESTERAQQSTSRPATRGQTGVQIKPPVRFWIGDDNEKALFTLDCEPRTLKDAQESPDWPKWKAAMDEEIDALDKNKTWELVTRPINARLVKNKWVYKKKVDANGKLERYKARLVAKGYSQIENVDYKETFAPVASMVTVRILFALACQNEMEIVQFDIKTAFLYGDLDETIFMDYPEGYNNPHDKVCKLLKSLYGLKQAPRMWNRKFDSFLKKFELKQSNVDRCFYFNKDCTLLLTIYVDDGLVASRNKRLLDNLIKYLQENFELKVVECESYLGFKVQRDRKNKTLLINQSHYISKVLERFNMLDSNPVDIPEVVGAEDFKNSPLLSPDHPFKELVGSLLYLVTCTRPDISHAVSIASRTSQPTEAHWKSLKRILRYLKGTQEMGIHFRWESQPELVGYSDADYAMDPETRRSTTGYCILFGNSPIAWRCQRQNIVTLSTTEAEYVSGCELVKELIPIRSLFVELGQIPDKPVDVLIDNQSTIKIATDEGSQQRTKHIDVKEKWLTEQASMKKINVKHVKGENQMADMLTKPLHKTKFTKNRNLLMGILTMLTLICYTNAVYLKRSIPITYHPTRYQYFTGDKNFDIKVIFANSCSSLFQDITDTDSTNIQLTTDCNSTYIQKVKNKLERCPSNLSPWNFTGSPIDEQRVRRQLPLLPAVAGFYVFDGLFGRGSSETNSQNIDKIKDYTAQERKVQDEVQKMFSELRNTTVLLNNYTLDVNRRVNNIETSGLERLRLASLVSTYQNTFDDYSRYISELNQALQNGQISANVRFFGNETLWDEPAAEWSHLSNCTMIESPTDIAIKLKFTVPIRDSNIKIMKATPINFFNLTLDANGEQSLCWMTYIGPKFLLYNTTNECISEVIESQTDNGSVRYQSCASPDDEIKLTSSFWKQSYCSKPGKIAPDKRRIQDFDNFGNRLIYCYQHNLTVDDQTMPCPDHPFEIDSKKTYKISNFEHIGESYDKSTIKTVDDIFSKKIIKQLKHDNIVVSALNATHFNQVYDKYLSTLNLLPQGVQLTKPTLSTKGFTNLLSNLIDGFTFWIHKVGIILGVIVGLIALSILSPFIQIVFMIGSSLLKFVWSGCSNFRSLNINIRDKMKDAIKSSRRTTKSWKDEYKRIV